MSNLRVTCDRTVGAAYIYLTGKIGPGEAVKTDHVTADILLDFDADGHLIGIELLDLSLLHPKLLKQAKTEAN